MRHNPGKANETVDGYRGIWFTLGQFSSEYGDKYSGGLGTYTADHIPLAIYAREVNKTFFVYGGTSSADEQHLYIMASWYDHKTHQVPRPTIVHDKLGVTDPHDNASMSIDDEGYIWVFISGRATARPGYKYVSTEPYSVAAFRQVAEQDMTYPQPWHVANQGFLHLFTRYTAGRELYWERSSDGITWSEPRKLAGFGGHYQVSKEQGGRVITAFNWHPEGNVDRRTNLYYAETRDMGETWKTVDGKLLDTPLSSPENAAKVVDYASLSQLVYIHDIVFDQNGHPVILYTASRGHKPGPQNGPRVWRVTHWTGERWETHDITKSDHNYDMGSLYVEGDVWRLIGPTQAGPQPHHTGGEMAVWISKDSGRTWTMVRQITTGSQYNHTYARAPLYAHDPFYVFWADGDASAFSPSRLYFATSGGDKYWQLPYHMERDLAAPIER